MHIIIYVILAIFHYQILKGMTYTIEELTNTDLIARYLSGLIRWYCILQGTDIDQYDFRILV